MPEVFDVRCHHCGATWIGEAQQPMEFVGMFKSPRDRELVPGPRQAWRCKSCGWINVFRALAAAVAAPFRRVEVK